MEKVKFWSRISRAKSEEWVMVEGENNTCVPLKVWKAFNQSFWQWKQDGLLHPLDELDAYQFACEELIRTALRLTGAVPPAERIRLCRASKSTYLVSAAYRSLMKYRAREVMPKREEYQTLAQIARVKKDDSDATVLDVRAFVESLPGLHSYDRVNAMHLAACCVHATLPKLEPEVQRGLRAYLEADGVWIDAAKIYACSRPWYYAQFKENWAPAFRKACDWGW